MARKWRTHCREVMEACEGEYTTIKCLKAMLNDLPDTMLVAIRIDEWTQTVRSSGYSKIVTRVHNPKDMRPKGRGWKWVENSPGRGFWWRLRKALVLW